MTEGVVLETKSLHLWAGPSSEDPVWSAKDAVDYAVLACKAPYLADVVELVDDDTTMLVSWSEGNFPMEEDKVNLEDIFKDRNCMDNYVKWILTTMQVSATTGEVLSLEKVTQDKHGNPVE